MENLLALLAAASIILLTLGVGGGVSDMLLKRSKRFNSFVDGVPMMCMDKRTGHFRSGSHRDNQKMEREEKNGGQVA